jgi:hypothetical protein
VKEIQTSAGKYSRYLLLSEKAQPLPPQALGQTSTFIQREKILREVDIVDVLADRGRASSSGVSSLRAKKGSYFFLKLVGR